MLLKNQNGKTLNKRGIAKMLKTQKEIVALDAISYMLFLQIGLELAQQGITPLAKVTKGF